MKFRLVLFLPLFAFTVSYLFAQIQDGGSDSQVAEQYVKWAQQAIDEERWDEALTALQRASDFASVSSDISYLLAVTQSHEKKNRHDILEALDTAIEINRWVNYNESQALLLKADQLIGMRRFSSALAVIDQIPESADAAVLRLLALRGMVSVPDNVQELARFRSLVLSDMDRYPRDPRPPRIFFEYARNKKPGSFGRSSEIAESDIDLLELSLRRLPFLLSADPDLAWLASPFMRDADAGRLMASYRAGGKPNPSSIPSALNLGLISDNDAIEELFAEQAIDKNIIMEIDSLLRSEESRDFLTRKLLSFSGTIYTNKTSDGYMESVVSYRSGVIQEFAFDENTDGIFEMKISFSADSVPVSAEYRITGEASAFVKWERYPSVEQITLADEKFLFRPAGFHDTPVSIIELGGSKNYSGLPYPVVAFNYVELTRRALVSFCSSLIRPSVEIAGAEEQIFLENGIPFQAVETLNGKQVSITEFERGLPVIQHIDLDLDGRMETIRRFRRPQALRPDFMETFNYRGLIVSSESDWTGDGQYKTGEVYLPDGSVVYSWDMDGGGVMNYSETGNDEENQ